MKIFFDMLSYLFFTFNSASFSALIILIILSFMNIIYSKSSLIKMMFHGIYQTTFGIVKDYAHKTTFVYLFIFVFCFVGCNNIISALFFSSIMCDPYMVVFFIGLDVLLGLACGLYYKKYRAITDISEPALPLPIRFFFFPIELGIFLARIITVSARLYISANISHAVLDNLIAFCESTPDMSAKLILFNIIVIIKCMDLFIGLIHPRILLTQMSMLFGKFNEEHHNHEV